MLQAVHAAGNGNSYAQIYDDSITGTPVLVVHDDQSFVDVHTARIELPRHEMIDFLKRALAALEAQP